MYLGLPRRHNAMPSSSLASYPSLAPFRSPRVCPQILPSPNSCRMSQLLSPPSKHSLLFALSAPWSNCERATLDENVLGEPVDGPSKQIMLEWRDPRSPTNGYRSSYGLASTTTCNRLVCSQYSPFGKNCAWLFVTSSIACQKYI